MLPNMNTRKPRIKTKYVSNQQNVDSFIIEVGVTKYNLVRTTLTTKQKKIDKKNTFSL